MTTHVSDQLCLELGMPWNGYSPRYLTQAHKVFRLAPEGASRPVQERGMTVQLELFPEGTSFRTGG